MNSFVMERKKMTLWIAIAMVLLLLAIPITSAEAAKPPKVRAAALTGLSLSGGQMTPAFAKTTYAYTMDVENEVASTEVMATAQGIYTIQINGETVPSGTAKKVNLNVGNNTITVKVIETAKPTNFKDYVVTVKRSALVIINFGVDNTDPVEGAVQVSAYKNISLNFNKNIWPGSDYPKIVLKQGKAKVLFNTSFSGKTMVVDPLLDFLPNNLITLELPAYGIKDAGGKGLNKPFKLTFKTEDTIAPFVKKADPAPGKVNISPAAAVKLTFSEAIAPGTAFTDIALTAGDVKVAVTTEIVKDTLIVKPAANLDYNVAYTLDIPQDAIKDLAVNTLLAPYSLKFTTTPDKIKPAIVGTDPVDKVVEVPTNKVLTVTFSENIKAGDTYGTIALKAGAATVECTTAIDGKTLAVTPGAALEPYTKYTLVVPAGALTDEAGNLAPGKNVGFTTVDLNPFVVESTAANKQVNVALNAPIKVRFSQPVVEGPNFELISLKMGSVIVPVQASVYGDTLTLEHEGMQPNGKFKLTIPAGAVMNEAELQSRAYASSFASLETIAPVIASSYPANAKTTIPLNKPFVIKFKEDVKESVYFAGITLKNSDGIEVPLTKKFGSKMLTLTPAKLDYLKDYTLTIPAGAVEDLAGNGLAAEAVISFQTASDKDKPVFIEANPANLEANVPIDKSIVIKFNEAMKAGLNYDKIIVTVNKLPITVTKEVYENTLILDPVENLPYSGVVAVTIPGGAVTDMNGNVPKPVKLTFFSTQEAGTVYIAGTDIVPFDEEITEPTNFITVTFNKPVLMGINYKFITLKKDGILVPGAMTITNNTMTIKPRENLDYDVNYELYIPTGAFKDATGNISMPYWTVLNEPDPYL